MKTPEQIEKKRLYDIEYRNKNKDKIKNRNKEWLKNNKLKKASFDKAYYQANKDNKKQYDIEYRKLKSELRKENAKKYYKENKERIKEKTKEYSKNNKKVINEKKLLRKANDPLYNLTCSIRCLIKESFKSKNVKKNTKTEQILDCSFEQFKQHIEKQFEPWMTWENRGLYNGTINYGWDIDHIIPVSTAKTEEELMKIFHYSNMRPLCSYINRYIKRDNI